MTKTQSFGIRRKSCLKSSVRKSHSRIFRLIVSQMCISGEIFLDRQFDMNLNTFFFLKSSGIGIQFLIKRKEVLRNKGNLARMDLLSDNKVGIVSKGLSVCHGGSKFSFVLVGKF